MSAARTQYTMPIPKVPKKFGRTASPIAPKESCPITHSP